MDNRLTGEKQCLGGLLRSRPLRAYECFIGNGAMGAAEERILSCASWGRGVMGFDVRTCAGRTLDL